MRRRRESAAAEVPSNVMMGEEPEVATRRPKVARAFMQKAEKRKNSIRRKGASRDISNDDRREDNEREINKREHNKRGNEGRDVSRYLEQENGGREKGETYDPKKGETSWYPNRKSQ